MKRRTHVRWRKEAADDEPLGKAMKMEEGEEGTSEAGEADNEQSLAHQQQQEDPIPMVLSLLSQHHRASTNKFGKDPLLQLMGRGVTEPRDKLFNSQLVQEVSHHHALFDFTCEEYKSIEARNRHWEEVSSRVGQPLEFVRTRWKTLRDRFKKEVRRVQNNQPGIPWQHYDEMIYLLPFVRDKLEEVPYCGGTVENSAATRQRQPVNFPTGGGQQAEKQTAAQQQPHMHSSTAAILDLAMNAVIGGRFSPRSSPPSNESAEHFAGGESSGCTSSGTSGGGGTAIVQSGRPFPDQQQQNGPNPLRDKGWFGAESDADEEDQLFCRIILKKLGKLEERVKERAKAKIMELLVEMQYGEAAADKGNKVG